VREILSVRFFAAVGAVVGLFFLLSTVFAAREVIDGGDGGDGRPAIHRIDLVELVFSSTDPAFGFDDAGLAAVDTELVFDASRRLRVVTGTPGEDHCGTLDRLASCAVVADLLGEGIVWFALVPAGTNRTVELPAIDVLEDGWATLVNGWQLPFAPVLDRRCDDEYASYRELREALGDDFTSIYGLEERRLVAVECGVRVPYAPTVAAPDDPDDPTGSTIVATEPVTTATTGTTVAP
jgi:hypothetical protein